MDKQAIILEIMGKELEQIGFEYLGEDKYGWSFGRKRDGIWQEISVCYERFTRNCLKMYFSTNAYGQSSKELEDCVPGILQESWKFRNEEEFRKIIEQFKEWTMTYGLEQLEKISVPTTEERPKPETNRYLYENHERLNEECRKKWGLEGLDEIEIVFALQDKMEELKVKPFQEVEWILVEMAAVFGHNMCWFGIGTWSWDEDEQICKIINIGASGGDLCPLKQMIGVYSLKKSKNNFIKYYTQMISIRNGKIMAGRINGDMIDEQEVQDKIFELQVKREKERRV